MEDIIFHSGNHLKV